LTANEDTEPVLEHRDEKQTGDHSQIETVTASPTAPGPADTKPVGQAKSEDTLEEPTVNVTKQPETKVPEVTEEHKMQSFEEWKHMRIRDQQQQSEATTTQSTTGTQPITNVPTQTPLSQQQRIVHKKNFASMDCGAKVLSANPEASGASHILTESKDDYLLNSCSNKVWFVIELCEPIQITDIEIANYELFSNVPKQFRVHASDRYPNKNWTRALFIGLFDAQPTRTLQLFHVDKEVHQQPAANADVDDHQHQHQNNYVKYVKFEMLSHYGNEHFCPLSLVRIYGVTLVDDDVDNQSEPTDNVIELVQEAASKSIVHVDGNPVERKELNKTSEETASKSDIIDIAYKAINNIIGGSTGSCLILNLA
jgi:hypothetical protein